jgi:hypothetical protein
MDSSSLDEPIAIMPEDWSFVQGGQLATLAIWILLSQGHGGPLGPLSTSQEQR